MREPSIRDYVRAAVEKRDADGGMGCPSGERLVDFYAGRLGGSVDEEIREHLVACGGCRELARDARIFVETVADRPVTPTRVVPLFRGRAAWGGSPRLLAAAAILAAGLAVVWWAIGWRVGDRESAPSPPPTAVNREAPAAPENPWRELQIAKATYLPEISPIDEITWRDATPAARDPYRKGMEAYARDDFVTAEKQLASALDADPANSVAHFYRGVSLLMLGRVDDALAALRAAEAAGGTTSREARWYEALVLLKRGDFDVAEGILLVLSAEPGPHRDEAATLLAELRRVRERR